MVGASGRLSLAPLLLATISTEWLAALGSPPVQSVGRGTWAEGQRLSDSTCQGSRGPCFPSRQRFRNLTRSLRPTWGTLGTPARPYQGQGGLESWQRRYLLSQPSSLSYLGRRFHRDRQQCWSLVEPAFFYLSLGGHCRLPRAHTSHQVSVDKLSSQRALCYEFRMGWHGPTLHCPWIGRVCGSICWVRDAWLDQLVHPDIGKSRRGCASTTPRTVAFSLCAACSPTLYHSCDSTRWAASPACYDKWTMWRRERLNASHLLSFANSIALADQFLLSQCWLYS